MLLGDVAAKLRRGRGHESLCMPTATVDGRMFRRAYMSISAALPALTATLTTTLTTALATLAVLAAAAAAALFLLRWKCAQPNRFGHVCMRKGMGERPLGPSIPRFSAQMPILFHRIHGHKLRIQRYAFA